MEENMNLNEVDEAVASIDTSAMNNDELKSAINKTLEKIRNQGIIIGYRVACQTILQIIEPWRQPNCSHREYERIFKKLEEFCGKALKQDEEATEATVQN